MISQPPRNAQLLRADEEQLDRAAIALRSGAAFLVALCPAELRSAALARLRGQVKGLSLPEPVFASGSEEMLGALVEQTDRRERVLSLVLGRDIDGALDSLNLHREKVLKGGPVILWLEDVAALQAMRERAPDAYSFRSTMVVLRGDGGAVLVATAEPEEVAQDRRRLKRARTPFDRAAALHNLAESLRIAGKLAEAQATAIKGLEVLPSSADEGDDITDLRALLFRTLESTAAIQRAWIESLQWIRRALAEADRMSFVRGLERRAFLLADHPGPFNGVDKSAVDEAMRLVHAYGLGPEVRSYAALRASAVARSCGDLRRARALNEDVRALAPNESKHNLSIRIHSVAFSEVNTGRLDAGEVKFREALNVAVEGGGESRIIFDIIDCSICRGELDAAERYLRDGGDRLEALDAVRFSFAAAELLFERGDAISAIRMVHRVLRGSVRNGRDGDYVNGCRALCEMAEDAHEAGQIQPSDLVATSVELLTAQDILRSLAGPDGPPWYPIRLLSVRARLLILTPQTRPEALDLAHQALDLARSQYPDLLAETGRALADHLLRAARPEDALVLLAQSEPEATSRGLLREVARLRAARILALIQRGDPPATIEPHIVALREALASTDAPRIAAETLRDLASRLPLTTTAPDPHALAEEAHGLFVAMPMPAEEARCLEIMGDVLLARGRAAEAKRRYMTARARLERYGLGLRLPLLTQKIDALP